MKASDLMTSTQIWSCRENTSAREAAKMMGEHDVGAIPILDQQGRLEGIVTDRDLCLRILGTGQSPETPVRTVMSRDVHCVQADADLEDIVSIMRKYKVRRVPVVNRENRLQGFLSQADLLRALHGSPQERELVEVLEVISEPG